jgi:hypothetical protein
LINVGLVYFPVARHVVGRGWDEADDNICTDLIQAAELATTVLHAVTKTACVPANHRQRLATSIHH